MNRLAGSCPYCGAPLDFDSVFCVECGQQVASGATPVTPITSTVIDMPSGRTCPYCNEPMDADAVFCIMCGRQVETAAPAPAPGPVVDPIPGPVIDPAPGPTQACAVCGALLSPYDYFCTKCGTPIGGGGVAASGPTSAPGVLKIFEGNNDDPAAEQAMRDNFHTPGGIDY